MKKQKDKCYLCTAIKQCNKANGGCLRSYDYIANDINNFKPKNKGKKNGRK